jgi:hypothetical protein
MRSSPRGFYILGLIFLGLGQLLFVVAAVFAAPEHVQQGVSSSLGLTAMRNALHGLAFTIFGGLAFVAGAILAAADSRQHQSPAAPERSPGTAKEP